VVKVCTDSWQNNKNATIVLQFRISNFYKFRQKSIFSPQVVVFCRFVSFSSKNEILWSLMMMMMLNKWKLAICQRWYFRRVVMLWTCDCNCQIIMSMVTLLVTRMTTAHGKMDDSFSDSTYSNSVNLNTTNLHYICMAQSNSYRFVWDLSKSCLIVWFHV